jgi:hypothetical protein
MTDVVTPAPNRATAREEDLDAVQRAVVDYCEGYYRRDPEQIARAFHSEYLKRDFEHTDDDVWYLTVQTPESMIDAARVDRLRVESPRCEIIIDDLSQDIASVRLYSDRWVDYLHVVKARGEWRLLHAAYAEPSDRSAGVSDDDEAEITATARDYVEAWYAGDAERHANAYHQEFVKRAYHSNGSNLVTTSPERMVELCVAGDSVLEDGEWEIIIDDVSGGVATVRVYSTQWVDFLHVAKARGRWGLLHASYHEI